MTPAPPAPGIGPGRHPVTGARSDQSAAAESPADPLSAKGPLEDAIAVTGDMAADAASLFGLFELPEPSGHPCATFSDCQAMGRRAATRDDEGNTTTVQAAALSALRASQSVIGPDVVRATSSGAVTPVPAPGTLALLLAGMLACGCRAIRLN